MVRARICMVVKNQLWNDARVKKEAVTLAGAGHSVTIVCHPEPGSPERESWNGIEIIRVPKSGRLRAAFRRALDTAESRKGPEKKGHWSRFRSNPVKRILGDLVHAAAYQVRLLRVALAEKADVYHSHDLDTLGVCALAAGACGARLVYDSHELWLESTRHISETGQAFRLLERLTERTAAPGADAVIAVTPGRAEVMKRMYPTMPTPYLVPNYPPLTEPWPRSEAVRTELGVDSEPCFLFLYQGIICRERGLEQLIEAAGMIRDAPVHIAVVGHDASSGAIREMAAEQGVLDIITFHPPVKSEELHMLTGSADAGLILFQANCMNHTLSLPNKLFEYMMSSLPVLSCDLPEIASVISREGNGVTVDSSDPSSIAAAMLSMAADRGLAARMGDRGRMAAESRYTWSRSGQVLLDMYADILKV